MVKADKEEVNADLLDLEKEEEGNISVGTSTGDLPIFTPRSSQTDHANANGDLLPPSFYDLLHVGPLHTLTLWPDAWTTVGDLPKLPYLGHSHHVSVVIL